MVTLQEPEYDAREQEAMQPEQEIEHLSATDAAATTQEVRRSILSARSARGGGGGGGMLENMERGRGWGLFAHSHYY